MIVRGFRAWIIFLFIFVSTWILHAQAEQSAVIESLIDYGKDNNENGLYESLVAEVSINVKTPMIFTIEVSLYSGDNLIFRKFKSNHLNKGTNKLKVNFEGKRIRGSQLDGPYTLVVVLYDRQRIQVSKATFETSFYSYNDFEN